jgi:hypothetical protein
MRKLRTNTRKTIDLHEWNSFVQEVYGRPYNFQQQDGCKSRGFYEFTVPSKPYDYPPDDFENDSVPEVVNHEDMGVSFKAWLARDPKQPLPGRKDDYGLELWWERNFYPSVDMIIEDLAARKLLEPGDYTILIDW